MSEVLTYQQELAWSITEKALEAVEEANTHLESRASAIAAISGGAASVVAGFSLFKDATPMESVSVVLFCVVSVAVAAIAAWVWQKRTLMIVGSSSVRSLYRDYISAESDDAYHYALSEMCEALRLNLDANAAKGNAVSIMFWASCGQLALLIVTVIVAAVF